MDNVTGDILLLAWRECSKSGLGGQEGRQDWAPGPSQVRGNGPPSARPSALPSGAGVSGDSRVTCGDRVTGEEGAHRPHGVCARGHGHPAASLQALPLSQLDSRSPEDRESWGPVLRPCPGVHVRVC